MALFGAVCDRFALRALKKRSGRRMCDKASRTKWLFLITHRPSQRQERIRSSPDAANERMEMTVAVFLAHGTNLALCPVEFGSVARQGKEQRFECMVNFHCSIDEINWDECCPKVRYVTHQARIPQDPLYTIGRWLERGPRSQLLQLLVSCRVLQE